MCYVDIVSVHADISIELILSFSERPFSERLHEFSTQMLFFW